MASTPNGKSVLNLELLIKLLKMTTSPQDGEALIAIRKANSKLQELGEDWDNLLRGKVKIVADPFASIPTPRQQDREPAWGGATTPQRPPPSPPARPTPSAPPPRPAPPPPPPPKSTRSNSYVGHCWCCGIFVKPNDGFIFKPNLSASAYSVVCVVCNHGSVPVPAKRAKRQQSSTNSILDSI